MILGIQKMTFCMEDYFRYFPTPPELLNWGLALSAAGFTRIPPHTPYPPAKHPEDHELDWNHGRVIESLQVVLVSDGGGVLETRSTRQQRVEAGMVFLLLPHSWHRYRPDPETGWVESWIEVRGPVVDGLLQRDTFPPGSILQHGAFDAGIEETLNRIHLRLMGQRCAILMSAKRTPCNQVKQSLKQVRLALTIQPMNYIQPRRKLQLHRTQIPKIADRDALQVH